MSRLVFKSLFARKDRIKAQEPSTAGRLVYAIGDIHGRLDLLRRLLAQISADAKATGPADRPVLVFLGDYVDRGPEPRAVVDCVRALVSAGDLEVRALSSLIKTGLVKPKRSMLSAIWRTCPLEWVRAFLA